MAKNVTSISMQIVLIIKLMYRIGLKYHDCLHETPEVQEALRRLPQKQTDERNFRMMQALQLSMQKVYLPKEKWMTYEEVSFSIFVP